MSKRTLAGFGLAIALAGCRSPGERPSYEAATLVVEGATLVDAASGAQRAGVTLVVADGRIAYVGDSRPEALPPGVEVVDASGQWVIPGLVDVHVHDASAVYLRRLLAWGVTSVHLMPAVPPDNPVEVELRARAPYAPTPRLQVTAMFAGAFPSNLVPGYRFLQPETPDEAWRDVDELYAKGYRQIKIIQDDSTLWAGEAYRSPLVSQGIVDALVDGAHANGMRIYVHATQRDVARAAIEGGLDAFMHGVMDAPLAAEDWRRMRAEGTVWTPAYNAPFLYGDQRLYARRVLSDERFTSAMSADELAQWRAQATAAGPIVVPAMDYLVEHTAEYVAVLGANTRSALDAGVAVAVGSDGGPAGVSTHLELELLQENGLSPTECLAAATRGGALALGRAADVGSIEEGKLADFVVLSADPTEDVRNCRSIELVVKGGRIY